MSLIKCRECGKEISDQAVTCPNCGCPSRQQSGNIDISLQKNPKKKSAGCLVSLFVFIGFCVIGTVFFIISMKQANDSLQKQVSGVTDEEDFITLNQYEKIETGMTYEEVVDIVGNPGIEASKVEANGHQIVMIIWYGNGVAGSSANVTFTNGKASAKAQLGLVSTAEEQPSSVPPITQTPEPNVAENTFTVKIESIYLYEKPEILAYKMEKDGIETTIEDNDTISATMIPTTRDVFLLNFKNTIALHVENCTSTYPICTEININDTYSSIDAYFSKVEKNEDVLLVLGNIMRDCLQYQIINGTPLDSADVALSLYSSDKTKLFASITWKTLLEDMDKDNVDISDESSKDTTSPTQQPAPNSYSDENIVYSHDIGSSEITDRTAFAGIYVDME